MSSAADSSVTSSLVGIRPLRPPLPLQKWEAAWAAHCRDVIEGAPAEADESAAKAKFAGLWGSTDTAVVPADAMRLELLQGLLFGAFSRGVPHASTYFRHLALLAAGTDKYTLAMNELHAMFSTCLPEFTLAARLQVPWMVNELIVGQAEPEGIGKLVHVMLRFCAGGDLSINNVKYTQRCVEMLDHQKPWVITQSKLVPLVLFTLLRLIQDHRSSTHVALQVKETSLCLALWQGNQEACLAAGRDMVRLLYMVRDVPALYPLVSEVFGSPGSRTQQTLLATRTGKRELTSRLTPAAESQLLFMMKSVISGTQGRYQTWFAAKFLATQESVSLLPDIVRYICNIFHPSKGIIQSRVVQRWLMLGWIMTCCKTTAIANDVKLAMFLDWLGFQSGDHPMLVEAQILLMLGSLTKYAPISVDLLQFLISQAESCPLGFAAADGITAALVTCVGARIVPSVRPLLDCPSLSPELRAQAQKLLPTVWHGTAATPTGDGGTPAGTPVLPSPTPSETRSDSPFPMVEPGMSPQLAAGAPVAQPLATSPDDPMNGSSAVRRDGSKNLGRLLDELVAALQTVPRPKDLVIRQHFIDVFHAAGQSPQLKAAAQTIVARLASILQQGACSFASSLGRKGQVTVDPSLHVLFLLASKENAAHVFPVVAEFMNAWLQRFAAAGLVWLIWCLAEDDATLRADRLEGYIKWCAVSGLATSIGRDIVAAEELDCLLAMAAAESAAPLPTTPPSPTTRWVAVSVLPTVLNVRFSHTGEHAALLHKACVANVRIIHSFCLTAPPDTIASFVSALLSGYTRFDTVAAASDARTWHLMAQHIFWQLCYAEHLGAGNLPAFHHLVITAASQSTMANAAVLQHQILNLPFSPEYLRNLLKPSVLLPLRTTALIHFVSQAPDAAGVELAQLVTADSRSVLQLLEALLEANAGDLPEPVRRFLSSAAGAAFQAAVDAASRATDGHKPSSIRAWLDRSHVSPAVKRKLGDI